MILKILSLLAATGKNPDCMHDCTACCVTCGLKCVSI